MAQDNCPFIRTKKNDHVRFNPPNPRVAITYQLYDDLRTMHSLALANMSEETWVAACNNLRRSLDHAKNAKAK